MITTKDDVCSSRVISHNGRFSSLGLREHHQADLAQVRDVSQVKSEKHLIVMHDGGTEETTAEMLFYPDAGRAGVAWGGMADWFDAGSPEEAARLWISGEWVDYE